MSWPSCFRQAIHTCEVDLECAGFTFQGTLDDYQSKTHVGFFRFDFCHFSWLISCKLVDTYCRFAANIINNGFEDIDWNSYLVDRPMATYAHQVSFSSLYHEHPDAQWMPGSEVSFFLSLLSMLQVHRHAKCRSWSAFQALFGDECDCSCTSWWWHCQVRLFV